MFLELHEDEIELALSRYRDYVSRRMLAVELSFLRIGGLLSALRRFTRRDSGAASAPWWQALPEFRASSEALHDFVEDLALVFTESRMEELRREMSAGHSGMVEDFLRGLPDVVTRHRATSPLPVEPLRELAYGFVREEVRNGAPHLPGSRGGGRGPHRRTADLQVLPPLASREPGLAACFSAVPGGRTVGYRTLPGLTEVRASGDQVVAVYPYEPGTAYEGGCLKTC